MPRLPILVCLFGLIAAAAQAYPPPPKDAKPDPDKLAAELGQSFLAGAGKRDFDAILKSVEYPYLSSAGKSLDKAEAVKREIGDIVSALWTEETKVAVKEVVTADKFDTWASALPIKPEASKTEGARKALLEHLGPSGRIVALQFEIDGQKDDDLCLLLVKIKDGKAVLVGLVD